ncbi:MAG: single-stranded DNA-binding protein [Methylicorpusculum sp.]|uniref:single-stranded DNA-binding protein n=1 Tax=Methylicorpusculum sp. TaxID=2713644 RepID=UPI0027228185|nr:single-stranded DNA-binding protein [Methylicorpusculum sp.]MDO8941057.1 single-stranded DNA-binding protein [Methylicorpusculum sp.]MDP2202344.1 single-stranded DNA-binding protein [Methylicorpusculum sp.]
MFNKAQLIGRLGRDPEIRYTQSQKPVAQVALATSDVWKDRVTGDRKEKTEWHRIMLFGKLAERARDYLNQGDLVLFEGPIRTRKWQDASGRDHYSTEIHADTLKMLGSGPKSKKPSEGHCEPINDTGPDFEDDIPF